MMTKIPTSADVMKLRDRIVRAEGEIAKLKVSATGIGALLAEARESAETTDNLDYRLSVVESYVVWLAQELTALVIYVNDQDFTNAFEMEDPPEAPDVPASPPRDRPLPGSDEGS